MKNLGFKKNIDQDLLKKILDIKSQAEYECVTVTVEKKMSSKLKTEFKKYSLQIKEHQLSMLSDDLYQYKFYWNS